MVTYCTHIYSPPEMVVCVAIFVVESVVVVFSVDKLEIKSDASTNSSLTLFLDRLFFSHLRNMAPLDGRWAPSRYHKELQRAIAFRSYVSILRSGVRKKQTQESMLERLYHKGETNEHGEQVQEPLVDQAIKGSGQFTGLCDRHSYISIDGGTGERKEEVRLVVQDCFTRTLSVRFIIGESFTRESLSLAKLSDNKKLVSGRTLRAAAELAHRNGKKAYEYAMDFLDENLELPPNKSVDDYDTYVLTSESFLFRFIS